MKKQLLLAACILFAAGSMAQNIDYSLVPYRQGSKWGYSDESRKIVLPAKYDEAQWFSEGLAAVRTGGKWGYINRSGKMVIPAKFTVAKSFRKGYFPRVNKDGGDTILFAGASLKADGYEQCINTKGVVLGKCPAINENSVAENRIPVAAYSTTKNYSMIQSNAGLYDKIVDDYKVAGSDETYYIAQKNGRYGVFNTKFESVVPFEYNSLKQFKSNDQIYLEAQRDGRMGIVTATGQAGITTDYSNMTLIDGPEATDYVILQKDGLYYVKDLQNRDVIPQGYRNIVYDNNGGFVITDNNNLRGYYFLDNTTIAPRYSEISRPSMTTRYLQVKTPAGKVGYINAAGSEYFVE